MRISDWSSDVCSSDLHDGVGPGPLQAGHIPAIFQFQFGCGNIAEIARNDCSVGMHDLDSPLSPIGVANARCVRPFAGYAIASLDGNCGARRIEGTDRKSVV